ncbi:MAG: hypothetical protein PHE47_01700 [Oscillospiraceae bacterium]|nr:hypothetical protein [Oscillospiraceae bacterium]
MYFGSVRFFKHLFLSLLILLFLIPTTVAVVFGIQNKDLKNSLSVLEHYIDINNISVVPLVKMAGSGTGEIDVPEPEEIGNDRPKVSADFRLTASK